MIYVFHADRNITRDTFMYDKGFEVDADSIKDRFTDGMYTLVAIVDLESFEEAFEATNHIVEDWPRNDMVQAVGGNQQRSTSVGDVMIKGNEAVIVAPMGFDPLP